MNKLLYLLIEFAVAFVLVYIMYRLFVIKNPKKAKKNNKKETKKSVKKTTKTINKTLDKKTPAELELFIKLNNIDEKKIDKNKVMHRLALLNAFDVALILLLTEITKSILLKALIALATIFVVLVATYKLYGLSFKKKGMTKDVQS